MESKLLIFGAKMWLGGALVKRDVVISDGKVERIAERIDATDDMVEMDGRGKILLPGLVDMHVHLRERDIPTRKPSCRAVGQPQREVLQRCALCPTLILRPIRWKTSKHNSI